MEAPRAHSYSTSIAPLILNLNARWRGLCVCLCVCYVYYVKNINFAAFRALRDCSPFLPLLFLKLLSISKGRWEAGELSRYRELRCGLTDRATAARLPSDARELCLLHCVQTGCGAHKSGGPPSPLLNGDRQKSLSEVKRL